jgi:AcrR family transcriptional regulator
MNTTNTRQTSRHGAADVETAILEAARDLLAEGGVAGLSMRQIADRVGVTATAIYHYFDGKQDLINRVVLSSFECFGSYLQDAMKSHPKGSVERLHALGDAYIRFAFENDAYFRVIFSIQPKSQEGLETLPEDGGYHLLREAVSEAIDSGAIRPAHDTGGTSEDADAAAKAHADVLSMYLWSLTHGLVTLTLCGAGERCEFEGKPNAILMLQAFARFVNDGIREPVKTNVKSENDEERCNCE